MKSDENKLRKKDKNKFDHSLKFKIRKILLSSFKAENEAILWNDSEGKWKRRKLIKISADVIVVLNGVVSAYSAMTTHKMFDQLSLIGFCDSGNGPLG